IYRDGNQVRNCTFNADWSYSDIIQKIKSLLFISKSIDFGDNVIIINANCCGNNYKSQLVNGDDRVCGPDTRSLLMLSFTQRLLWMYAMLSVMISGV
ncbi:uncharacterized protein V6R79_019272, partial [Siganus canaliculatus]